MDIFRNMQIFVEVARAKSFRGAADNLGIPNSTVSRRISELERDVGLRLFDRSTRRVTLTDLRATPSGRLRVSSNMAPANEWIIPLLPQFSLRYPDITIELDIVSDTPSPTNKGVDVAVVMGPVEQEDLVARQIVHLTGLGLYASPGYIQQHGEPRSPADLCAHEGLTHLKIPKWRLINRKSGEVETISPRGRVSVANFTALQDLCLADMGICVWHKWRTQELLKKRRLQRVLPQWSLEPWEFYAVTTSRHVPARVRAFIDFLIEKQPT